MAKPPRKHPPFYYTIRDIIIARSGPVFNEREFQRLFPAAARPHSVIPYSDGYPAIRRIIMSLVKARMKQARQTAPKAQLR